MPSPLESLGEGINSQPSQLKSLGLHNVSLATLTTQVLGLVQPRQPRQPGQPAQPYALPSGELRGGYQLATVTTQVLELAQPRQPRQSKQPGQPYTLPSEERITRNTHNPSPWASTT